MALRLIWNIGVIYITFETFSFVYFYHLFPFPKSKFRPLTKKILSHLILITAHLTPKVTGSLACKLIPVWVESISWKQTRYILILSAMRYTSVLLPPKHEMGVLYQKQLVNKWSRLHWLNKMRIKMCYIWAFISAQVSVQSLWRLLTNFSNFSATLSSLMVSELYLNELKLFFAAFERFSALEKKRVR